MRGFFICIILSLIDTVSSGSVVSSSSSSSSHKTYSSPSTSLHQQQGNFILASGESSHHNEDIRMNTYPEIFDQLHCVLDEIQTLSSSNIEKLVRKCVKPNNHFPLPSDTNCNILLQHFDVVDIEENNDLYNNEDNKGRADRENITRKLCSKISGNSDWRVACKAVDILQ